MVCKNVVIVENKVNLCNKNTLTTLNVVIVFVSRLNFSGSTKNVISTSLHIKELFTPKPENCSQCHTCITHITHSNSGCCELYWPGLSNFCKQTLYHCTHEKNKEEIKQGHYLKLCVFKMYLKNVDCI